jgi:outer membrane protein assembly factor BamD
MMKHWMIAIGMLAGLLFLAACDSTGDEDKDLAASLETEALPSLYNDAMDKIQQRDWKGAKAAFEEVERQHPYSEWAKRAQVMNAYANYENQDYVESQAILERFTRLYPGDDLTPYAYYLMALGYYEQISDVGRDQAMTAQALNALQEVIRRYPDSDYARDAKLKRELTIDHLAGKEMEVGRYYLSRKEYAAAIRRFSKVIADYQTTSQAPEALHRLVECYLKMGVQSEAKKYAAVLGHNFPKSPWYKDSYRLLEPSAAKDAEPDESWLGGLL